MKVADLALDGTVWLTAHGALLGGRNRIDLLRAVDATGSITQAAAALGISYKAAWDAVDSMNNVAGVRLVERTSGGRGGGHTALTDGGRRLVERYGEIEALHARFVARLSASAGDLGRDLQLLRTIDMKTSARNQFSGTVAALRPGAVNDEVEIEIAGGLRIVAVVTHESAESLGLSVGAQAFALVKSSSVLVATDLEGGRISARNRFVGTVERIERGAVNDEVVVASGPVTIAAIITSASAATLGLVEGAEATAFFKASSVIVGVSG